ncbi:hypothetical protein HanHA300_Chr16g0613621 [Helianthus annuus]|nr:hypothetical protein HanHA300_Chr16g0613621 [Helianthus annuus]KAJ0460730.1 hypothetical protein HanHA89_Chr16g0664211 [Helianthus annuus]
MLTVHLTTNEKLIYTHRIMIIGSVVKAHPGMRLGALFRPSAAFSLKHRFQALQRNFQL